MSDNETSNADPEWTILASAASIRELARNQLGEDVTDDVIFRCLTIVQATMDVTLSVACEMEIPVGIQGALAEDAHDLSYELLSALFTEIAQKRAEWKTIS